MPVQYEGISAEHEAVRKRAGIFDVSHMGELRVTGKDAVPCVDRLITNSLAATPDEKAIYTCCCNDQGTILDDLIVYRLAHDDVLVVCNASNLDKIANHFEAELRGEKSADVHFENQSAKTALLAVQGPQAIRLVESLGAVPPPSEALAPFAVGRATLRGHAVTLARTGYTGEDGLEIFCENEAAGPLWDALTEAGVTPVGLGARDTLRLEARLSLYGNEIDESTHPYEAGLGWVVKLDSGNFIGRDALVRFKERGNERRIVGFEMQGRGIARHGYPLLDLDGHQVGHCTSGAPSPTLGKSIGLGYLPVGLTNVGQQFEVDCRGRRVPAVVVKTPFYRRPPSG
jgi:aminomethyltransferase